MDFLECLWAFPRLLAGSKSFLISKIPQLGEANMPGEAQ
jgi:hypothetical protein